MSSVSEMQMPKTDGVDRDSNTEELNAEGKYDEQAELCDDETSWQSMPSVVTWYSIRGRPLDIENNHFLNVWESIYHPIQKVGAAVFVPISEISSNLFNAWDLSDLVDDLRFQPQT
jgi:hypothetical protein